MSNKVTGYLSIENAKIGFRNFSGRANTYNAEGQRNFCVFLEDDELAEKLIAARVKMREDVLKKDKELQEKI